MKKNRAFTLAEILITLVIIGIVAALTIPTLMNSTGDKEYVAASKRVLATVAEAGRQMAIEDDIKRYKNVTDFVENGLSKRIDINKYCAPANTGSTQTTGVPTDCGFAESYIDIFGHDSGVNMNAIVKSSHVGGSSGYGDSYAFTTNNGYSYLIFYNKNCKDDDLRNYFVPHNESMHIGVTFQKYICAFGIYDMNGKKGPNYAGKDLGAFGILYAGYNSVAVTALPDTTSTDYITGGNAVKSKICIQKGSEYHLPSKEELLTMAAQYNFFLPERYTLADWVCSGTPVRGIANSQYWGVGLRSSYLEVSRYGGTNSVCIR